MPGDWSTAEQKRWLHGLRGQRAVMASYNPVRWPERMLAPPAWRDEIVLIALATLLTALSQHLPEALWCAVALQPLWHVVEQFETRARRRSATRLRLTPEALPRQRTVSGGLFYFAGTLGPWGWRKLTGRPEPASRSWTFFLAARLIAAIDERRSWRRALTPTPGFETGRGGAGRRWGDPALPPR